jgi:putative PIN family toxin of toxin-antitoxin system
LQNSTSRKANNLALLKGVLVYSEETVKEFEEVFSRKKFDKYATFANREKAIRIFKEASISIPISSNLKACRDPKDDMFLHLAVDAKVKCIVTGDPDLLELHPFEGISILTPNEFLEIFDSK